MPAAPLPNPNLAALPNPPPLPVNTHHQPNEAVTWAELQQAIHNATVGLTTPQNPIGTYIPGRSPFAAWIVNTPTPTSYRDIHWEVPYDGLTDPTDHIHAFDNRLMLYSDNDGFKCKVFPQTLSPNAIKVWWNTLAPGSIQSWEQLTSEFQKRYVTARQVPITMVDLAQCKQSDDQTLKQYSDTFWILYGKIRDPIPTEAIRAFQNGLQASRNTALLCTLVHDRPVDINTLMHIVHDFQLVDSMLESEQRHRL